MRLCVCVTVCVCACVTVWMLCLDSVSCVSATGKALRRTGEYYGMFLSELSGPWMISRLCVATGVRIGPYQHLPCHRLCVCVLALVCICIGAMYVFVCVCDSACVCLYRHCVCLCVCEVDHRLGVCRGLD